MLANIDLTSANLVQWFCVAADLVLTEPDTVRPTALSLTTRKVVLSVTSHLPNPIYESYSYSRADRAEEYRRWECLQRSIGGYAFIRPHHRSWLTHFPRNTLATSRSLEKTEFKNSEDYLLTLSGAKDVSYIGQTGVSH